MFRNKHGNVTKLAMFDRDGTINVDVGHLHEPDKIELIDSTVEKMRYYANDSAWNVAVVSNQAGVAKGLYGINEMRATNEAMEQMLEDRFVRVDAWYYCPHHPEFTGDCDCRKPAPGMLLRAMRDFDACPDNCVMYGDKDTDRKAAEAAGVNFFWAGMGLEEAGDIADE
jgi:D,D-heptose 1,7-bisphosphate phosphatase